MFILLYCNCLWDQAVNSTNNLTSTKNPLWGTVPNHGVTELVRLKRTSQKALFQTLCSSNTIQSRMSSLCFEYWGICFEYWGMVLGKLL